MRVSLNHGWVNLMQNSPLPLLPSLQLLALFFLLIWMMFCVAIWSDWEPLELHRVPSRWDRTMWFTKVHQPDEIISHTASFSNCWRATKQEDCWDTGRQAGEGGSSPPPPEIITRGFDNSGWSDWKSLLCLYGAWEPRCISSSLLVLHPNFLVLQG